MSLYSIVWRRPATHTIIDQSKQRYTEACWLWSLSLYCQVDALQNNLKSDPKKYLWSVLLLTYVVYAKKKKNVNY